VLAGTVIQSRRPKRTYDSTQQDPCELPQRHMDLRVCAWGDGPNLGASRVSPRGSVESDPLATGRLAVSLFESHESHRKYMRARFGTVP
jgi:hypothetical protein